VFANLSIFVPLGLLTLRAGLFAIRRNSIRGLLAGFAIFFLLLAGIEDASAEIIEIQPLIDASVDYSNGGATIMAGQASINIQDNASTQVDRRGVLEFDLGRIPDQAIIASAILSLDISTISASADNYPTLAIYGYSGNGTLETGDGQATTIFLGESAPIYSISSIDIDLDPTLIQPFLSASDYLGLLALGDQKGKQTAFISTEGQGMGLGTAPKLTISYVPEPGVFVIFFTGGVGFLTFARHRRSPH
jgi:hypothetical protein